MRIVFPEPALKIETNNTSRCITWKLLRRAHVYHGSTTIYPWSTTQKRRRLGRTIDQFQFGKSQMLCCSFWTDLVEKSNFGRPFEADHLWNRFW